MSRLIRGGDPDNGGWLRCLSSSAAGENVQQRFLQQPHGLLAVACEMTELGEVTWRVYLPGVHVPAATAWFAGPPRFLDTGMTAAPRRRGLAGPAPEGSRERTLLRVFQGCRDLAERHVRMCQQLARDLEADFVRNLPECEPLRVQVSGQGAAVHREEAGDPSGGTGIPENFAAKHSAQILGERT
jgi:hypothetical protein